MAPIIEETIKNGGEATLTVVGISMFPLLLSGRDSVVLEKAEHVKKYDVVFYRRANGKYVLHRILGEKCGAYMTAGDNQTIIEYPVQRAAVIAKAKGFYRKGRYISAQSALQKIYAFLWAKVIPYRVELLKKGDKIRRILHGQHKDQR